MKNKTTPLQLLLIALLFTATIGCGDDDTKAKPCSEDIDLGLFTTDFEVPYDSFQTIELESEEGELSTVAVNHPSEFAFVGVPPTGTTTQVFDCEMYNTVEKYSWKIESKQTLITTGLDSSSFFGSTDLIKETPLVDESKPQDGPVGTFLEFYDEDIFSGAMKSIPYMRVMTHELQAGKGGAYEHGYTLLASITINGETFEQVYTNTESLAGFISYIYYNESLGLVGVKDENGVLWRVTP